MEVIKGFIDFFLHLDDHMAAIIAQYGNATYAILFTIIFAETGLVIAPLLPGDSLLFVLGALSAQGSLNIFLLWVLLFIAAVLGDALNYAVGAYFKNKILLGEKLPFIKQAYLDKTHAFYVKHGPKTIIIARFVPIVRTFAPFLAGVGDMPYSKFALYNIIGALLWVTAGLWAGYFFGNIPFVSEHFSLVVLGIVVLSLVPVVLEILKHQKESKT
jgi:membrane-associated protein